MSLRKLLFLLAAVVAAQTISRAGSAQLVTFRFDGTVTSVDSPLGAQFAVGNTVTGFYTTNLATPDSDPAPNTGQYQNPFTALSALFSNGYSLSLSPGPLIDTM